MSIARVGDWIDDIDFQNVSLQIIEDKYPIPEEINVQGWKYEIRKLESKSNIMYRLGKFCTRRQITEFRTYGIIELDYRGSILHYNNVYNVDGVRVVTKCQGTRIAAGMYTHFVKNNDMIILGDEEQFFGARKLWTKLSRMEDVCVDIIDLKENKIVETDVTLYHGSNDWEFDTRVWSYDKDLSHIRLILRNKQITM
jgi:hypothetical protein